MMSWGEFRELFMGIAYFEPFVTIEKVCRDKAPLTLCHDMVFRVVA